MPNNGNSWSAAQYTKFEAERNRPIRDLLAHLPTDGVATAADIGCGPGNSTELLAERYPTSEIQGIDSSPDMIEAACKRLPTVNFEIAEIESWSADGPFDVILANAVLQWVPRHEVVLPALMSKLSPSGCLAVQMPDNLDEPAHRLMREVAARETWSGKLGHVAEGLPPRHNAEFYYRLLRDVSLSVDVWRTTYYHPLAGGASAVVEWFKGTGLRPFIDPLDPDERQAFLAEYEEALRPAYPALPDGTVLLPFPRLFLVAALG